MGFLFYPTPSIKKGTFHVFNIGIVISLKPLRILLHQKADICFLTELNNNLR